MLYQILLKNLHLIKYWHRRQLWEAEGRCPLRSNTEGGEICLTPLVFWQVIPTWQQEIQNSGLR